MLMHATSSGAIATTAGSQVVALESYVTDVQLLSNGTAAATMQVYDGTSTSGVLVASLTVPASTIQGTFQPFNIPVCCNKGIFVVVTGTGAQGIVHYVAS